MSVLRRSPGNVVRSGRSSSRGVSESLKPIGLDDDQEASWLDHDALASAVNEYASPSVSFEVQRWTFQENKIVIIRVEEFEEIPILCKKDFHGPGKKPPVLRRGACYVRASHKPETSEIPSEQEMRELLELAVDKGVVKFLARVQKAGFLDAAVPLKVSDPSRFRKLTPTGWGVL